MPPHSCPGEEYLVLTESTTYSAKVRRADDSCCVNLPSFPFPVVISSASKGYGENELVLASRRRVHLVGEHRHFHKVHLCLRCDAQELSGEVALVVQNFPLVPEANELLAILGRFDLDGLLQSHDEIARLCGVYEPVVPVIIPHQHSVRIPIFVDGFPGAIAVLLRSVSF